MLEMTPHLHPDTIVTISVMGGIVYAWIEHIIRHG